MSQGSLQIVNDRRRVRKQRSKAQKSIHDIRANIYGQATKRTRRMPWQLEAMKDVGACEKLRGVGKQTLILRCPNGETHPA